MHLLLPPSEKKSVGGRGRPLRDRLGDDALGSARARAIAALLELVSGPRRVAATALALPDGVIDEALAANAAVLDSRTTPALRRYAGVVYDGLSLPSMSEHEQHTAARHAYVFSGLFGVVRGDEPLPAYRVPAKAVLPHLGIAGSYWRPLLPDVLASRLRRGLIVDLRSSDYAVMWRPDHGTSARVVTVRILSPVPRGGYGVISYNSKFAKGQLAATLIRRLSAGDPVATREDVASAWAQTGGKECSPRPDGGLDLYTG